MRSLADARTGELYTLLELKPPVAAIYAGSSTAQIERKQEIANDSADSSTAEEMGREVLSESTGSALPFVDLKCTASH